MSRIPRGWSSWLVLGLIVALVASASAGLITKPYTFSPGTTISSSQMNANFDTAYNAINGDLDDANVSSLSESKLVFSATGHAHSGGTGGAPVQWVDGTNITAASSITIPTDGNFFTVTGSTTINALSTRNAGVFVVLYFTGTPTIAYNGTSLILFGGTPYTVTAGDVLTFKSLGSGNWRQVGGPNGVAAGNGITITRGPNYATIAKSNAPNVQVFTANGTWTKPAGLVKVKVTVIGGGGSGSASPAGNFAGGGGGGGTCIKYIAAASLGATESVTVGSGGTGVSPTANGNAGNASSFGSHCSASGGNGGIGNGTSAIGGPGGIGSGGDINSAGSPGASGQGAGGGSSMFGGGASPVVGTATAGRVYGGGGSGGPDNNTSGAGATGVVIVEEH